MKSEIMCETQDLHGGNVYRLARESGCEPTLDYSANINPLGVPHSLKQAIYDNIDKLTQYPDPDYVDLKVCLAKYSGVSARSIVVGNGATELIFLYFKALQPKRVLILAPTFAEYARAAKAVGCEIDYFELKAEQEFRLDFDHLASVLAQEYDLLVCCNPNNPTGVFMTQAQMMQMIAVCQPLGCRLLLDEAFIEFVAKPGQRLQTLSAVGLQSPNLFIIRALTKFFAIPGLRLGFAVHFDPKLANLIETYREPWSVNTFAELAAHTVLNDHAYMRQSLKWLAPARSAFIRGLSEIPQLKVYPSQTNFLLLKLFHPIVAPELRQKMIALGILIRDASNFIFLDEHYIRLAIKDEESNQKVIYALKQCLQI